MRQFNQEILKTLSESAKEGLDFSISDELVKARTVKTELAVKKTSFKPEVKQALKTTKTPEHNKQTGKNMAAKPA